MGTLERKQQKLVRILRQFDSLLVAFSGGVDSTYLLAVAVDVLGDRVVAITSSSKVHPAQELEDARRLGQELDVRHIILETHELDLPAFRENPRDRCYFCKKHLFQVLRQKADELNVQAICHGANQDDLQDIRPGFRAAKEAGIHAPLLEAELTKADIRELSRQRGLPTWNKPAMACLATRIPFGAPIQEELLQQIASAEKLLYQEGFSGVRVRYHEKIARIEMQPADFARIIDSDLRKRVVSEMKRLGFLFITLDLDGYIQGSMSRKVEKE